MSVDEGRDHILSGQIGVDANYYRGVEECGDRDIVAYVTPSKCRLFPVKGYHRFLIATVYF